MTRTILIESASRKNKIIIFLICFLSYAFFTSNIDNPNIISRIGLTVNLVQEKEIDLGGFSSLTEDKAYYNGKYYSDKAPGMSFLAAPVAYLFTRFAWVSSNVDLETEAPDPERTRLLLFTYVCTLVTSGLLTAVAAVALFGFIEKKTGNWRAAAVGTVTYALGTPTWGWATSFFGHASAGALLILGFVFADRLVMGSGKKPEITGLILISGLALGTAITVEFPAAVPVAIILIYLFILNLRKRTIALALVITAAVGVVAAATQVPLLLYNAAAFGAPFKLGYSNVVGFEEMKTGLFGVNLPQLNVLGEILFGPRRGIVWLSPVLVFAVLGTLDGLRNEGERARGAVIASIVIFYLLLNAGYAYWDGGWSTGPRHITPAFPFLALALAALYMRASSALRMAILVLLALSVLINLICVSVTMTSPEKMANPLLELILPSFLRGDLDQSVLNSLFDAHGLWQLIPLLATWLFLGTAFLSDMASKAAQPGCREANEAALTESA